MVKFKLAYLCDGFRCNAEEHCGTHFIGECKHCFEVKHARNGKVKGPIDFLRRFKFVGYNKENKTLYFEEKIQED